MTTTTRLQKAIAVLSRIESGINAVKGPNSQFKVYGLLAGGCARDVHFGKEPKDWDIVFGRDVTLSQIEFSLREANVSGWTVFPFYNTGLLDRIKLCVKFKLDGEQYDVLVYDVDTAYKAVAEFDFNLNQFIIDKQLNAAIYVGGTDLEKSLVAIRGDHSVERGMKMHHKYSDLKAEGKL